MVVRDGSDEGGWRVKLTWTCEKCLTEMTWTAETKPGMMKCPRCDAWMTDPDVDDTTEGVNEAP